VHISNTPLPTALSSLLNPSVASLAMLGVCKGGA
jgi:hypothetical protein